MILISDNAKPNKWYNKLLHTIFEENYHKVYRVAIGVTGNEDMAKDATQEAFIRAFLYIDKLDDKEKFCACQKDACNYNYYTH